MGISPFICKCFFFPINFSRVLESSNFVYTMRTTKCITVSKEDNQVYYCKQKEGVEIYIGLLFLFFLFFYLSLECNEYGEFWPEIFQNHLTLSFEIWFKH